MNTTRQQLFRVLGGSGSGNFDHAGRPGEVGGSSESGMVFGKDSKGHVRATVKIVSEPQIYDVAAKLSRDHGGAWVVDIPPFSQVGDDVHYIQFKSPSNVPDSWKDLTKNRIAYQGKIIPFTKAAQIREQNRGMGCE